MYTRLCETSRGASADYVLVVQGHRASIHQHTVQAFEQAEGKRWYTEVDKCHGRLETRCICVLEASVLPKRKRVH